MSKSNFEEAQAFNRRIQSRIESGFTPDLRKLKKNEYFYKSFWRDPILADLYVGELSRTYINLFKRYLPDGGTILDVGCGPGYFALELARAGFEVVGIDIAEDAISAASNAYSAAKKESDIAPIKYKCMDPRELLLREPGVRYSGILSSGFLHHIPLINETANDLALLLDFNGVLVIHEPQHKVFTLESAFWISVIRNVLSLTKNWYQEFGNVSSEDSLSTEAESVYLEYIFERDPEELHGQSPNDLSCDREEILRALSFHFEILEDFPSRSFIYRTLGGLRGDDPKVHALAKYLTLVDSYAVREGLLEANYFFAVLQRMNLGVDVE